MNKFQARQGDIFFESVTAPPAKTKPYNSHILAYGEVTGHSHAICESSVASPRDSVIDEKGNIYLRSEQDIQIDHDEHGIVELPANEWICVSRQREYEPLAVEEERRVAD